MRDRNRGMDMEEHLIMVVRQTSVGFLYKCMGRARSRAYEKDLVLRSEDFSHL